MEIFLEEPLEGWRIGGVSDKHHPGDVTRVHTLPEGVDEAWKPINVLGKGAFGEVWGEKCQRGPQKDKLRAVKIISKANAGFSRSSQRELEALDAFSAKNNEAYGYHFVQFLGWFEDPENLYIAMDFMPHGNLQQYIDDKAPFPERESSRIARQVAIGLNFMHKKGFLHRDLKPQNILVDTPGPDWKVKIADFGIAKQIAGSTLYTQYMGSYGYIAPELFDTPDEYSEAADIWALGALVFTMCTGAPPFEQPRYLLEYRAGTRGFPSQVLGLSTGFCIDFILGAMHANPRSRLRMIDLLNHEWLSKDKSLERMRSNRITRHESLRSFDNWDLKQAALDDIVIAERLEPIEPNKLGPVDFKTTCLGCGQRFSAQKDLKDHIKMYFDHQRWLEPGEGPWFSNWYDPFVETASSDRPAKYRNTCLYCRAEFESRNDLFEHLDESGHAVNKANPRMNGPAYMRPEESRKRDTKLARTLASVEKEREELHARLLQEYRYERDLYQRAEKLKREKRNQRQREKELQRREDELKQKEELLKQKEEEALTESRKQQVVALKQDQEQEKQKRQRESDEAETSQPQETQQRQPKRPKTEGNHVCRKCASSFDSRSQLFKHLRQTKHRA